MVNTASPKQRGTVRRFLAAMPASVPAGLGAVAVLTGPGEADHLPAALTWALLMLLGTFVVADLVCGWLWLAHRRTPLP